MHPLHRDIHHVHTSTVTRTANNAITTKIAHKYVTPNCQQCHYDEECTQHDQPIPSTRPALRCGIPQEAGNPADAHWNPADEATAVARSPLKRLSSGRSDDPKKPPNATKKNGSVAWVLHDTTRRGKETTDEPRAHDARKRTHPHATTPTCPTQSSIHPTSLWCYDTTAPQGAGQGEGRRANSRRRRQEKGHQRVTRRSLKRKKYTRRVN